MKLSASYFGRQFDGETEKHITNFYLLDITIGRTLSATVEDTLSVSFFFDLNYGKVKKIYM